MNFFLIYSGSGIFIGLVTPVLLALDYYGNTRHLASRYRWGSAAALAISIASLASFFVRYKFNPAVDCFSPAPRNPIGYLWFVALMLAHVAGLTVVRLTLATLIGSIALLLLLVGLCTQKIVGSELGYLVPRCCHRRVIGLLRRLLPQCRLWTAVLGIVPHSVRATRSTWFSAFSVSTFTLCRITAETYAFLWLRFYWPCHARRAPSKPH